MINNYKFSEKEMKELRKSLVVLVDTREQQEHIVEFFEDSKIPHKITKLPQGDYSFMIPKNDKLGICRDLYFDKDFSIERKASLEELAGNFTKDRARLKTEFAQHKGKMILLIENSNYDDIATGNYGKTYNKKYQSKTFLASLHSMSMEFDIPFIFIGDSRFSGLYIHYQCWYFFRNLVK